MRTRVVLLLSSVAMAACASPLSAADLPVRTLPAVVPVAPIFTWTGFYIGVNAGAAFNDEDDGSRVYVLRPGSVVGSGGTNGRLTLGNGGGGGGSDVGFTGGGQIGYNYQFGAGSGIVVGVEADYQYADHGGSDRRRSFAPGQYTFVPAAPGGLGLAFAPPPATVKLRNVRGDLESFGTVRGRLGYAFDRVLVYATGGFAYSVDSGNGDDGNPTGYTVGGGVEYAFTNNITVKVEGLYVDLESDGNGNRRTNAVYNIGNRLNGGTLKLNDNSSSDHQFGVARVGVNLKF